VAARDAAVPDDLTCGCPCDGRPVYSCLYCDNSRCQAHVHQHDHSDDEMAVAHAARVEPAAADWDLWEEQFYSLEPLVERVKRIREGRR
jgi:hypothetical protein